MDFDDAVMTYIINNNHYESKILKVHTILDWYPGHIYSTYAVISILQV